MLEGPEVEPHHHHTGHSKIDIILGCTAVFLSCVSVFIAIRHGDTMERLVAANTWPNLDYSTSNEDPEKSVEVITLDLRNTGVGPARIETFEVFYKGKPMANARALAQACCITPADVTTHAKISFATSLVMNEVLPARENISFIRMPKSSVAPDIWDAANKERFNIAVRACYCSVFDECWVYDSHQPRPARVDECKPSQAVQYDQK
jgi:hypothetical protein